MVDAEPVFLYTVYQIPHRRNTHFQLFLLEKRSPQPMAQYIVPTIGPEKPNFRNNTPKRIIAMILSQDAREKTLTRLVCSSIALIRPTTFCADLSRIK